jgi:hypothetical protein
MDSYNRTAGLNLTSTELGTAIVSDNSADLGVTGADFFAQAYTWNGHTVISYRGTDSGIDAITGWATGGGAYRGIGGWSAASSRGIYMLNMIALSQSAGGGFTQPPISNMLSGPTTLIP